MVKVRDFSVVQFEEKLGDNTRTIILIYALGEDGIIYEMSGGRWLAVPIEKARMRVLPPPPLPVLERKNNG